MKKKSIKLLSMLFSLLLIISTIAPTVNVDGNVTVGDYIPAGSVPTFNGSTDKPDSNEMTYKFAGWDVDGDGIADVELTEDIQGISEDTTFTAVYNSTPVQYSVSWNTDGRVTTKEYEKGAEPKYSGSTEKPATATKTYSLIGWDSDGDNVADIMPGEDFPAVNGNQSYLAIYKTALPLEKTAFTVDTTAEKYTGEAITKNIASTLIEGKDYKVSYSNNVNAGTATIKISGMGSYGGEHEYTFEIRNGVYVGKVRYATLAAALAAVPMDNVETKIEMYSDLTAATKCYIYEGQNIVLDMNGCTYTSTAATGYALNVQSDGKISIYNGKIESAAAGGISVSDGGTVGTLARMEITTGKQSLNNAGMITKLYDSKFNSATIAIYNTGTIGKIYLCECVGATYGMYNAGSISCTGAGSYKATEFENALYTADIGSTVMTEGSTQFVKVNKNNGKAVVVPNSNTGVKISERSLTNIPASFANTGSKYFGVPSLITNQSAGSGYYGTGSVICEYDTNGEFVASSVLAVGGDINGDSVCDVLDLLEIEKSANGHIALTGVYLTAADNNNDETIDINDFTEAVNIALR